MERLLLGLWIGLSCSCLGFSKAVDFTILTFNDVYDIHPKQNGLGGFAQLKYMLDKARQETPHHITTMNGDFLFPSMLSTFDKGKHRVELFNEMQVDLVVLGNHEFDFGPQVVKERISESEFLWFGANVYDIEGNYFSGEKQTLIVDVDGVKIGFFGIVTGETPILSSTENSVLFCPLTLTARRMCEELKEQGADVIVALTHLFMKEDLQLASEVPEIHVLLGGHDHEPVTWYEHDALIVKTGQNAAFLGKVKLHIEIEETDERKVHVIPSWEIIANHKQPSDPYIQTLIEGYDQHFNQVGYECLTILDAPLDSRHGTVRGKESTMANLILDALREKFHADIALMSGGIIRGDQLYPIGTALTYQDLMRELAFDNQNVVIEISGFDLLKAIEHGVSQCQYHSGRFPQVSGMEFFFNENLQPGERVIDIKIGGEPLSKRRKYRLATNTYNQKGGDGFFSLCNGDVVVPPEKGGKLIDTVKDYLKKHPHIHCQVEGRIQSFKR